MSIQARSKLLISTAFLLLGTVLHAQTPEPPAAPLPSALATASQDLYRQCGRSGERRLPAYLQRLYAGVQNLHRFEMVGDPDQADLVLELHYEFGLGAGVNGGTNTPRQFRVIVEDPRTRVILWSLTERSNYAVFQKNRDRNLDETIGALVNDFDALTTSAAPKNHSVAHH